MSDRFATTLTFGGVVQRADLDRLVELSADADYEPVFRDGETVEVYDGQGSYETFGELRQWLRAHNLPYRWQEEAKYEYDGIVEVWFPGMEHPREQTSTADGSAVVQVDGLKHWLDKGRTLADVVAEFEPFLRELPPLRLRGDVS